MEITEYNNIDSENSFDFYESEDILPNINDKANEPTIIIETISLAIIDNETNNEEDCETNKIREELLQKKTFYKLLFADYKKFLKKINFISFTETSYDVSVITNKSTNKSQIYNIKETYSKLYKNIKNIKKDLFYINQTFNNNILVLDGENILKSNKYQQLIKLHLTNEEFNKYFNYWFNGGENGIVQPMTSLNLSVNDKIVLTEILIKNYLSDFNCIVIISGKSDTDSENKGIFVNDNKALIIPVLYNKEDIREQDDHLMLYIYYHIGKNNKCEIISGDKFKWFNHTDNYLKNFRLEYDFNNTKINIRICDAYSNDIIIYKNYTYQIGYFYFPFIQNFKNIIDLNIEESNLNDYLYNFMDYISEEKYDFATTFIMRIFINLIEINGSSDNNTKTVYSNFLISLISKIIHTARQSFEELAFIINRVSSISKKAFDKIEKYDCKVLYNIIFKSTDDLSNLSSLTASWVTNNDLYGLTENNVTEFLEYIKIKRNINKYIFLTNLYLILKSMSFLLDSGKPIIKIAKMFSNLMKVYDKIDNSIHKIRKISNELTELNKTFLKILSHHIYMKKNGFCKKDY